MIIQKAGIFKFLRYLGVFCAITMGFMTIVATSAEDAADTLGIKIDFEEDVEMELEPVTVEKSPSEMSAMAEGDECNDTSVNQALVAAIDAANIDVDIGVEDIADVELQYVSGSYTASWTGDVAPTQLLCTLEITGLAEGDPSAQLSETVVDGMTGILSIEDSALTVVNHYLANPTKVFEYCATCTDTEGIESYIVDFDLEIGVTISGEI